MRSVFFHLVGVTRHGVAERLSKIATPNGPNHWSMPNDTSKPVLYIGFFDDLLIESEPEDLDALTASLGMLPTVTVTADVSGRSPGDKEIRELAALLLNEFNGVAWDDHTTHCWTISEIQSNVEAYGHVFFDYKGYPTEQNACRNCDSSPLA